MLVRANFLSHWYYHVPDLILTLLVYLLLARLALGLIGRPLRALDRVTDPVVAGVAAITPRVVPPALVVVFAAAWLVALRLALFVAVTARGVRLSMG